VKSISQPSHRTLHRIGLAVQAKENFVAAEPLIVGLLNSALLATAATRGRQSRVPTAEQAGVWLFSEALPRGWLEQGQAVLIMIMRG
jgi:hypothetical protein